MQIFLGDQTNKFCSALDRVDSGNIVNRELFGIELILFKKLYE